VSKEKKREKDSPHEKKEVNFVDNLWKGIRKKLKKEKRSLILLLVYRWKGKDTKGKKKGSLAQRLKGGKNLLNDPYYLLLRVMGMHGWGDSDSCS